MTHLPLDNRRIVITRAKDQADEWLAELQALGAEAISLPTIAIAPPRDPTALDHALGDLAQFDGFIFTSVNGVHGFHARAEARGRSLECASGAWVCAIGPATAAAMAAMGWRADIVPKQAVGESVVAALAVQPMRGKRVLMLRAEEGRELIPRALAARGADVVTVATYRTVLAEASRAPAMALFPGADAAVFTSPSTARNLAALLGDGYRNRLARTALAAIGPVTRQALERLGLTVATEASATSPQAMADALVAVFGSGGSSHHHA